MDDHNKTKDELIRELAHLRSRVAATDQTPYDPSQTIQQLQSLTQAAESLLGVHDLPSLWPRVRTAVQSTLHPDRLAIYLYDQETDTLSCPYAHGLSQDYINHINQTFHSTPGDEQLFRLAPVWSEDAQNDPAFRDMWPHYRTEGFRTLAIFPLIDQEGRSGGGIALYWNEIRPLNAASLNTGHTLAHMVALAINTITLFSQTRQSLLREKQLNEISRTLSYTTDLPTLLGSLVKMVAELVNAEAGLLGLVIDRDMMTFYPYNVPNSMSLRPAPRPRGLAWQIVNSCEAILLTDYPNHPEAMQKWIDAGLLTFLGVPLRSGENCLGVLTLFNLNKSPRKFNERDLQLVESIGQQAGVAIQNLRQLAEAQQRAAAMAAALNRQAELDQMKNNFTQSVSHELRSPLGIIYGHAELLASESLGSLNEEQKQSGEIIMRRVMMLTNLVDDLTALLAAETQELRREDIDTTLLVYSLLADYRIRAEELGITLQAEIDEAMPWVKGDSTHLRRVFDNLVSNAFKFTPPGGQITLRLKAIGQDVQIEVEDNGEGIPEDKVDRIFERFYQVEGGAKRRHKGTGLGLTLVKEIIEAHRGTVSVRSQPGLGTTFTIFIPGYWPE
ncbi:MAG: ATP-binding protein [Chloroflexota bacterium]